MYISSFLLQDPKVSLSSLVGSSTPRAVERHGPSKLRIGSNDNYLDIGQDNISNAHQVLNQLLPCRCCDGISECRI